MPADFVINAVVEGIVDEAVVRRLVQHVGAIPGGVYGKNGKGGLRQKIPGYNNAARYSPWIVIVDLDSDADCAQLLRLNWIPDPAPFMCFRVAVREMEAWLLADGPRLASFLQVAETAIPHDPECLANPKDAMVNLARHSRSRAIQKDMIPRAGSGIPIGALYSSRLIEFASKQWRPEVAARRCDSLRRAIECLKRLTSSYHGKTHG